MTNSTLRGRRVTPGTAKANSPVVLDTNKDITGIRNLTASGTITTGSTTISAAEIGVLDSVTPGTAAASKAVVLGASKDIATITSATITTLTSTTVNATTVAPTTLTAGTVTNTAINVPQVARTTSALTKNASTTYANVTGLSFTVVPGTYVFTLNLPSTVASGTGGIKYCFNYTTAVLSALEATAAGTTASAIAVQHTTTTTTQTDLFTEAAVVLNVRITGSMVVTTGGTVDVQMAQNTSDASNTVALVGGYGEFIRIA